MDHEAQATSPQTGQARNVLLEVRGLNVRFGGLLAVAGLDLDIVEGEILALVGPNGAGKTTVLNCISGFVRPAAGSIRFAGRDLLALGPERRAALGIGRTFQNGQLFASLTVLENLLIGRHAHLRAGLFQGLLPFGPAKREDAQARQRAREILAWLGLEPYANRVVATLPAGLQKLVGVARALAGEPRLLLLDEPAAGVPMREVTVLVEHLRRWCTDLGLTLLLIEHNMHVVQAVAQRVCVLNYGRKLTEGEPTTVLREPAVLEAYLGREEEASPLLEQEVSDHAAR
ncbi:ABC transporter ATP-binding protein [Thermogemmatispora sp.]|uniref:ABC transporter ATP-binding protein n=1 Tax=Thermogemmatispora sp. TaxID=1968838 RepID=UPI001D1ADE0B|nr:ABC transporter ATP-binding protein [Thermogemmatispora sp.]MBX5448977.1 ABC transporter ATP-binding protein [Thermogemmatispora sp.]